MKTSIVTSLLLTAIAGSLLGAEPKDDVKAAAKNLAQKPNYSWVSTPKSEGGGNAGAGAAEGKTEKSGFTYVTLSVGNADVELAFKGAKAAIKRADEDWKSADELEGNSAWIAKRLKEFKTPAAEAADLAEKVSELKKSGDNVYSGSLSEEGVKELFARARRRDTGDAPEEAKGSAKFWIQDGILTKYQYNVQGKLTVGAEKREVEVNRTTTVEIKDVGATSVKVSDEAKKKLS